MRRLSSALHHKLRHHDNHHHRHHDVSSSSSSSSSKSDQKDHNKHKLTDKPPNGPPVSNSHTDLTPYTRYQLIELHKNRLLMLAELKKKISLARRALYELEDAYETSAGTCPCFRYVELQDMIRQTLLTYHVDILEEGEDPDLNERVRLLSPLERLREHAKQFCKTEQEWAATEEHYQEQTDEEIRKQIERYSREVSFLSKELYHEEAKLERLEKRYMQVRHYCCWNKYKKMKMIIEEATKECLTSQHKPAFASYYLKRLES